MEDVVHNKIEKKILNNDKSVKASTNFNSNLQITDKKSDSEAEKDEIRSLCLNIFINFAKLNKKDKSFYLTFFALVRILKTVNIISKDNLSQYEIEIILKKVIGNDNKMNSEQFMKFLVHLSNKLDPDSFKEDPKGITIKIIKLFFIPLSTYIQEKDVDENELLQHKDVQVKVSELAFDENIIFILNNIHTGLKNIYKTYFYYEVNEIYDDYIKTRSLSDLLRFCKDFEITPFLISNERIGLFYHMLVSMGQEEITKSGSIFNEIREMGVYFGLSRFASLLVHLSIISFNRYERYLNHTKQEISFEGELDNTGKFILFLERLQSSNGFEIIKKKISNPFNSKMRILPSKEIIETVTLYNIDKSNIEQSAR
jgi:hypothetical protein